MPEVSRFSALNIMVIDDDEFMLDVVSLSLKQIGITAVSAFTDGGHALSVLDAGRHYDIIMVDLKMPVMDGIEVLRNLAMREYAGGILLFSGEDVRILKTAKSLAGAHHLNVLGSLQKPVTIEGLREKLSVFNPAPNVPARKQVEMVTPEELRYAITSNQLVPYFQPKIRMQDNALVSVEVLARWQHPERGLILPISFIPVAEEHHLIDALTRVMLRQSLQKLGQWQAQGYRLLLGINLCADTLAEVDLPEQIADLAQAYGVACSSIALEITESRLMQNITTSLDVLARFRLKGFGLSIDDFGTGYSSMVQLNNIPFTELKIDRAFVHGAAEDSAARAILESSAELATKLGMVIVAEGVEDQADWAQAAAVNCDMVQGNFIAKPMPADEFEAWMKSYMRSEV